jgi:hypothetical protein
MKMNIKDILAKYENFYVGGSGYTFKIVVDDFNTIVKHIETLEIAEKELSNEIKEHCETKGLLGRQVFTLTKRVDELVEENKKLKENGGITGKEIANLIYEWANKNNTHPDDFDSLFVPELLEKLEKDFTNSK